MWKNRDDDRLLLAGGLFLLLLFAMFTLVTKQLGSETLDNRSLQLADNVAGGGMHSLFAFIEPFGSPVASSVLAVALATVVAVRRNLIAGVAILVALGVLTVIEGLLRVRLDDLPWDHLAEFAKHPRGWHLVHSSYPSGHTARLGLLAGIAVLTFVRKRPVLGAAVVVGITLWIGVQRIESGSHTGADVIGGALLAWGLALVYSAAGPWLASADDALRRRLGR